MSYETPDATRKLTITANSIHGEKEILWAMRATDLILALHDIRETFFRMKGMCDSSEIELGEKGLEVVLQSLESYGLTDLLETVT